MSHDCISPHFLAYFRIFLHNLCTFFFVYNSTTAFSLQLLRFTNSNALFFSNQKNSSQAASYFVSLYKYTSHVDFFSPGGCCSKASNLENFKNSSFDVKYKGRVLFFLQIDYLHFVKMTAIFCMISAFISSVSQKFRIFTIHNDHIPNWTRIAANNLDKLGMVGWSGTWLAFQNDSYFFPPVCH